MRYGIKEPVVIRRIGAALTYFIVALVLLRLIISISRGLALSWLHVVWGWNHEGLVATTVMLVRYCNVFSGCGMGGLLVSVNAI
jgi:hypothetical protein